MILGKPFAPTWSVDSLEAIASFVDEDDVMLFRRTTLALGFAGSYIVIVERETEGHRIADSRRFDRFVEALAALDAKQRELLALTPERLAALAMLDELRGLYATGELAAARRFAERCVRDLAEAFAIAEAETDLPRPVTRDPAKLGDLCESALAGFVYAPSTALGRVRQLCALAADLDGGPRSLLETRPSRGREAFTSVSAGEAFESLALPVPITHPAEPVDVSSIPVIPAAERPTLVFPARDRYTKGTAVRHPLTDQYTRIESRIFELAEIDAPPAVREEQVRQLQQDVADLAALSRTDFDLLAFDGWGLKRPRRACELWNPGMDHGDAPSTTPTLVWLGEDRIAVARDSVARIVSRSGAVVREIAIGGAQLQSCDLAGRYLVTTGKLDRIARGDAMYGFGCVDVETGDWLAELPDNIPAVTLLANDNPETFTRPLVFDLRHRASFMLDSNGAILAAARGNRAALLSNTSFTLQTHGIRALDTLFEEVRYEVLAARRDTQNVATLLPDGTLVVDIHAKVGVDMAMEERWDTNATDAAPAAIAEVDGRWRFLLPNLYVGDVDATWFHVGWPIDAASFSPDGKRLAVLGDAITIIDVEARTIERTIAC